MSKRSLLVMRHAKAAWPEGVNDVNRPLASRGQADAGVAAEYLSTKLHVNARVLVSPALRTSQTWDIVAARVASVVDHRVDPSLYQGSLSDLLGVIRGTDDDCSQLLVIAHNPGCAELSAALQLNLDPESFPTSAIAEFSFSGKWCDVGQADLVSFVIPRI